VLLGHTRLKILDLSPAGDQPMAGPAGRTWVVFNGEIYNHRELRAWLGERGHRFRGRSDTEVIPHLYEEVGPAFVGRLRGMFAFALYDSAKSELVLARDRFGIKPLYFALEGNRLAFASEIGALREVGWVDFRPDPQALYDVLAMRYVPAPQTFFRGVQALEPGRMLRVHMEVGRLRWELSTFHRWTLAVDRSLSEEDVLERTAAQIEAAVGRQLEAHVPLGAFLSGGIDSSLVSAAAVRRQGGLRTFNLQFPDSRYDETAAATAAAGHMGSKHTVLEMEEQRRDWETVRALVAAPGQPFADTSLFGVDAVCRAARRHVTVALSGDGGDEGFAGYDAYRSLLRIGRLRSMLERLPLGLPAAAGLARAIAVAAPSLGARARSAFTLDEVALAQRQFGALAEEEARRLCAFSPDAPARRHFEPRWDVEWDGRPTVVDRLQALAAEINVRLVLANDFLPKVDTGSMRHSLEVRVPMLDEELMDFALSLPWWRKITVKEGKVPLRRLAAQRLPAEVVRKPKHGFGVPLDLWLPPALKREVTAMMLARSSPLFDVFRGEVFQPWLECFGDGRRVPGLTRSGLHLRVMLLLSVYVFLTGGAA